MSREIIGVFTKFLRYRQKWLGEVYKGTDLAGNKYYEIPAGGCQLCFNVDSLWIGCSTGTRVSMMSLMLQ